MKRLITRRRLAELNAQSWQDFKAHWPMEVLRILGDLGGGFAFGLALVLALFVYATGVDA